MPDKCKWPDGIESIKPDGINELDPCQYDVIAEFRNVTVQVLMCRKCQHVEFQWIRQPDTEGWQDEEIVEVVHLFEDDFEEDKE